MAHTLELPDSLFTALSRAAEEQGVTPADWIAARLSNKGDRGLEKAESEPKTMADLFAGRVGRIRSGGQDRLSEDCGEKFADHLEAKRKAGHL